MTLLVRDIRLPLGQGEKAAAEKAVKILGVPRGEIAKTGLAKVSVDARKHPPVLVYTVAVTLKSEGAGREFSRLAPFVSCREEKPLGAVQKGEKQLKHRPVVCGMGPAGLFAALLLAREGYRPLILERGPEMNKRAEAVKAFEKTGVLDPNANIQFGEGGAGAFSDGKLTTRIGDPLCGFVTDTLLRHGAPAEIAYRQKPHIGTDLLRRVIAGIRDEIISLGGEALFETALTGLVYKNGVVSAVKTAQGEIPCQALVLAVGHSARDTFDMLRAAGVPLRAKPFSVGFRAEHLQSDIDRALYHGATGHPDLPPGEYQLSCHVGGRGVYTFCMCPGGYVCAAASEEGRTVTNGMSYHARDGKNANAAVVVGLLPEDFDGDGWRAVAFQRELEERAFQMGGGGYAAPAQNAGAFLKGEKRLCVQSVVPTYPRGVAEADLGALYPAELTAALRAGMRNFGKKISGYDAPGAILTGPETRTSSPLRIPRGEDLQCETVAGLYPAGEGAGYAGGIMSAAVDGLRCARALIETFAPPADGV